MTMDLNINAKLVQQVVQSVIMEEQQIVLLATQTCIGKLLQIAHVSVQLDIIK